MGSGSGKRRTRVLRVGCAQVVLRERLSDNLEIVLRLIGAACEAGCRVVVFPENALADSEGEASGADFEAAVKAVQEAAREAETNVVVGISATIVEKNNNRALVIDRTGEILLDYQKNREVPQRVWIDGVPCTVAICSDRWYIENADLACVTQGSQVMIDISGGHGGDDGRPDLRWVRYPGWAIRNSAFVVVCNPPHDDAPDYMGHPTWGGHSAILDPDGGFLARAQYEKDVLIQADLEVARATRQNAERRRCFPALASWWDAGRRLLEGDRSGVSSIVDPAPVESPEAQTRIAAVQMAVSEDAARNVARMTEALGEAAAEGVDVVVFPARATSRGADVGSASLACVLETLCACAREHAVGVVVGMPWEADGVRTHSAMAIGPDGRLLTRYDQVSVAKNDRITPGSTPASMWFRINGVAATVTLEDDLFWPELTELAAYGGAQLHFHLDCHESQDGAAALVRRQSAINHLMPAVCGVYVNAAAPGAGGGSMMVRRAGGHGKTDPGGLEAYLPYHTSIEKSADREEAILRFTAKTPAANPWQMSRNRTRRAGRDHDGWWRWVVQGTQVIRGFQTPAYVSEPEGRP